ncbi:MAG: GNAT family N-acetyltransferase [Clostridia bacterium]|jgi:GNAT superfamily N-acetyltransferase
MIYPKKELLEMMKKQLALEYNCSSLDFDRSENIITVPRLDESRRHYSDTAPFFKMATFGGNTVISADEKVHEWLRKFIMDKKGIRLFEYECWQEIDNELVKYDRKLWGTCNMFLPDMKIVPVKPLMPVRWFEQDQITQFYGDKRFSYALCDKFMPERPDTLAVAAYDGDEITGMAACSADTPMLWQIGIDVDEKYRSRGVGSYLVTLLKNEIINRGRIPFYGTWPSNLYSYNTAIKSGFFPAWIEALTKKQ